jgi:hypothetical protein
MIKKKIFVAPANRASGALAAGLQAGFRMEDDHDILAESFGDLRLSHAQAFAGCDHEHDRYDAPGDAEHGQECAQLVRPEGPEHIADKIA